MKRGDVVHGKVPEFSDIKHYFIVVHNRRDSFCLLPITSEEDKWDYCFKGDCIDIDKIKIEEGEVTLKNKTSYLFLGLFAKKKDCCSDTDFKASDRLLNKLRDLNIDILNDRI